jgi:hypothetical protein
MTIQPAALKALLFPELSCDLDEANYYRVRNILDYVDCRAIPTWLALAIRDDPVASGMMHVQVVGKFTFLWPMAVWQSSRDFKMARLARTKEAMRRDMQQLAHSRAMTKYQTEVYQFAGVLAKRIIKEFFPSMKYGYLHASFERILTTHDYDVDAFKRVLDESFQEEVMNVCWYGAPEKPEAEDTNEQATTSSSQEAAQQTDPGGAIGTQAVCAQPESPSGSEHQAVQGTGKIEGAIGAAIQQD